MYAKALVKQVSSRSVVEVSSMDVSRARLALLAVDLLRRRRTRRNTERLWARNWLINRSTHGSYARIFRDILYSDGKRDFFHYLKMPKPIFYFLLRKIEPYIKKQDTVMRESICAGARLEATLLFLTSGASYTQLQYHTRISKSALSAIIPETCSTIYQVLRREYLKTPRNESVIS